MEWRVVEEYIRGGHGMGWDGMGWDGMGWDGMGWDGMGSMLEGALSTIVGS